MPGGVNGGGGLPRIQPMQSKTYAAAGIALALALVLGGAGWWYTRQAAQAPQYRTAAIERGAVVASLTAGNSTLKVVPSPGSL